MNNQPMTLQEAEQYAAQHGIALTPEDRARIGEAQRAELARLVALKPPQERTKAMGLVESFNRLYPRFLEALGALADVLLTFSQTVIVAFGVPVVLILLMVVEHQRVVHGIELFEVDANLAAFAAAALVITNLVLEFTIHYVELKENYHQKRAARWSLRIGWANFLYFIGWGDHWIEQPLSPAQRYRTLLRLVTFSILALALAGSMRSVIASQQGAWHEALIRVVTASTLEQMMTWTGGLLFALAAVLAAQGLSRYVAMRCTEILMRMQTANVPAEDYMEMVDAVGASLVVAMVRQKLEQEQREREAQARAEQLEREERERKEREKEARRRAKNAPFGSTAPALDGLAFMPVVPNGNGHTDSANGHHES